MMKALSLICLLLCLGMTAGAQQLPPAAAAAESPPDISVSKYSWSKERIGWERDPFGGPVESFGDMRRRTSDERRLERARAGGNVGEANRIERDLRAEQVLRARQTAPPRYSFLYKISITNAGAKTVQEVDLDYAFLDAATGQEIGRRRFTGAEKVKPGKSKEFSFSAATPPTHMVSVYALDKNEQKGLRGQVLIMRVQYADGSVWQRP